jgi:hypothetical protein
MIISKQQLDADVLSVYNSNTEQFNKKYYLKNGKYSEAVIVRIYGKWSSLCKSLELPYAKRNEYSKEEILKDIKSVCESTNNYTRDNYLEHGKYSKCTVDKFCTSWNDALETLGFEINMNKNVSKEDVITEMLRLQELHKGYFTAEIQRKESKYSQRVIDRLFGSFSEMLIELDLRSPYGKAISDEQIINELKSIYDTYGTIYCDLIDEFCSVSFATVIHRFGSLYNAYELAGINFDDKFSRLSNMVINLANDILGEKPKREKTFKWLVNPNTNRNLYIDAYYKNHNLAIEIDGRQHFVTGSFVGTKGHQISTKELEIIQNRDALKTELINKNNIKLLRIPYNYTIDQIIESINLAIKG